MVEPYLRSTFGPRVGHGNLSSWTTPTPTREASLAQPAARESTPPELRGRGGNDEPPAPPHWRVRVGSMTFTAATLLVTSWRKGPRRRTRKDYHDGVRPLREHRIEGEPDRARLHELR